MTDGQRDGSIVKGIDPDRLAVEIIAFIQGAVLQWHLDPDAIDLVLVFDRYFDRLIEDVTCGTTTSAKSEKRARKKSVRK